MTEMTPRRLREIATQMEQVCIGFRQALSGKSIACDDCKQMADELRAHAEWLTPKAAPKHETAEAAK